MKIRSRAALTLGAMLGLAALLSAVPVVSVPGLVGYWRLDETAGPAADDSGNANSGTWQGAPVASSSVPAAGPPGIGFTNPNCLDLDGVDDYVEIGNPAALDLTAAITVAAWVNIDTNTTEKKAVAKWSDSAGSFHWLLSVYADPNPPAFVIQPAGGGGMVISGGGATVPVGTWTHLVGTFDGTNVSMYVNGANAATLALAGTINPGTTPIRIGAGSGSPVSSEEPFDGRIDDVRIYNRALTAGEITTLYNGQLPSPVPVLTPTPQNQQVGLSWTASTGAASYNVRRGTAPGGPYPVVTNVAGTTYTDPGLTNGTTYYYQIGAVNIVGEALSLVVPATPGTAAAGSSGRDNDNGDGCSCSTIGPPGAALPAIAALAAMLLALAGVRSGSRRSA